MGTTTKTFVHLAVWVRYVNPINFWFSKDRAFKESHTNVLVCMD